MDDPEPIAPDGLEALGGELLDLVGEAAAQAVDPDEDLDGWLAVLWEMLEPAFDAADTTPLPAEREVLDRLGWDVTRPDGYR